MNRSSTKEPVIYEFYLILHEAPFYVVSTLPVNSSGNHIFQGYSSGISFTPLTRQIIVTEKIAFANAQKRRTLARHPTNIVIRIVAQVIVEKMDQIF